MKTFESISEIIGWLKIVISLSVVGIALGWIVYYNFPDTFGIIIGSILVILGLGLGIYFATKSLKGKGTAWTATRHSHSPDLDKK